jgi:hypothetical protein
MHRILGVAVVFGIFCSYAPATAGIYAPAAGKAGSTAIYKNDSSFVSWATGYENYIVGSDVTSSWQTPDKALGQAVGDSYDIVCLGNGGSITLSFGNGIGNGDGWDFAVFENSFSDTFLELAYVEVSSDGVNFFRFSNDSQTASSVGAFGSVDPTNIDGLGGKYRQGYGTPFDLADLAGVSDLLDINNISYVRIVDIIGNGTCLDSSGDPIYDPYNTVGSGGFDLDAIGVIHEAQAVPIPGAVWLLGSGILGLLGFRRRPARRLEQ